MQISAFPRCTKGAVKHVFITASYFSLLSTLEMRRTWTPARWTSDPSSLRPSPSDHVGPWAGPRATGRVTVIFSPHLMHLLFAEEVQKNSSASCKWVQGRNWFKMTAIGLKPGLFSRSTNSSTPVPAVRSCPKTGARTTQASPDITSAAASAPLNFCPGCPD